MNPHELAHELELALAEIPVFDVHTHLVGGKLGARGLHDILLYHMVVSDLYAAGCPSGARLSQYPLWPSRDEAHARLAEAIPFLPLIRNTSSGSGVFSYRRRICMAGTEPLTADNWRKLDDRVRERADDRAWHHGLLDRMHIVRTGTEIARREAGADDDRLQYALEWGFFTRCQWGEFDTALYELERCWGRTPESPAPIGAGGRPATERTIRTLDDVRDAIRHYVASIPYDQVLATATHISTDIQFPHRFRRRHGTGPDAAGRGRPDRNATSTPRTSTRHSCPRSNSTRDKIVFQFSLGAEPLPYETGSRLSQQTIAQLADMIGSHPQLRFQCFLSERPRQSVAVHARPRTAQSEPGRILVAQLLSGHDHPCHGRTARHAADQQADRVLLGRVLPGMDLRQAVHGPQATGAGLGAPDLPRPVLAR